MPRRPTKASSPRRPNSARSMPTSPRKHTSRSKATAPRSGRSPKAGASPTLKPGHAAGLLFGLFVGVSFSWAAVLRRLREGVRTGLFLVLSGFGGAAGAHRFQHFQRLIRASAALFVQGLELFVSHFFRHRQPVLGA